MKRRLPWLRPRRPAPRSAAPQAAPRPSALLGLAAVFACTLGTLSTVHPAVADGPGESAARLLADSVSAAPDAGLLAEASALAALGSYQPAAVRIERELERARAAGDDSAVCRAQRAMGEIEIARGRFDAAERSLESAIALARRLEDSGILAEAQSARAQLSLWARDHDAMRQRHDLALAAARRDGGPALRLRVGVNAARASLLADSTRDDERLIQITEEVLSILAAGETGPDRGVYAHDRLHLADTLARWSRRLRRRGSESASAEARLRAFDLYRAVVFGTRRAADDSSRRPSREEAYAQLGLARLYHDESRLAEARLHAERAAWIAQQLDAPEILQTTEQMLGRLHLAAGSLEAAGAAYERSLSLLRGLRGRLARGFEREALAFRDGRGSVYYELVDVLLRRVADTDEGPPRDRLLRRARDVVEQMKADELRDYLGDACVERALATARSIDEVAGDDAIVVYPIVLEERLELLVTRSGRIERFRVPVAREQLEQTARRFRRQVEDAPRRSYLRPAAALYDWIVGPWSSLLSDEAIRTVVFIPDGALRSVPLAALHDGRRFLIERVATAVTPGLSLLDPRPLDLSQARVLAGGLSQARLGFAPLQHVARELEDVEARLGARVLLDERFTYESWRRAIASAPWSVLHVATHAEFRERSNESLLLTHDRRVPLDRFETLIGGFEGREQPLELLVLSACETAAGSEKAALGLSGVAVRSGARSVLGTLWTVDDAATARLIDRFYERLLDAGTSRAEALRAAQRMLLEDEVLGHPAFWSPFVLVNNWI